MANTVFSPTYNSAGTIVGGWQVGGIRAGFQPGTGAVVNARSVGVILGNNPAIPVFVPYGQTWPR
jgi:hypothetical protein